MKSITVASWFTDDTAARCIAYGWYVVYGVVGYDADSIKPSTKIHPT